MEEASLTLKGEQGERKQRAMKKILITSATRAGSTVEVATHVAEVLRAEGASVDVQPVKTVHDVKGYDAVIRGLAIRMGNVLPEAVAFVKAHRDSLSRMPTVYFLVSGFLREDTPEMRQKVLAFLDPVRAILEPMSIGLFAGKMDYRKLSWLDRTIARAIGSSEGDWRNWEAIRGWAHDLLPILAYT
jgi:menaquinone-dependent protoporphyrinogen oxidase